MSLQPSLEMFPAKTYFPRHEQNRMQNEGDLVAARQAFFERRPRNLTYLLKKRYAWMNDYLDGKSDVIEVGSGAGFAKQFIEHANFKLTDVKKYEYLVLE